jgi:RNA polymerase sigma-70 factor (ECF subfamily)
MDDRELWERIRRKDASAFDVLYRSYGAGLRSFLKQLVGQAAEDVAQDTFASLWQNPNGFDPKLGTIRSYVFGAARKRAAEWWRQQKFDGEPASEAVEECKAEAQSLIGDAFRKLPIEQRSVLWLREVEGHSYVELAEIFGIPEGTVRSRLFAARRALKHIWHATGQSEEGL